MISIVVPVYNVENYLSRCIESILNQTYQNFELILVDDGSQDKSAQICDEYGKICSKIKVIHQENQGPSVTRNKGTEVAAGEYITYIDSDDVVHPDYLKVLHDLCEKYNAELSCCAFSFFTEEKEILFESESKHQYMLPGLVAMNKMLYGELHGSSACALLIKTDIAKRILFTPGKYHEDDLISFKFFSSALKVGITDKAMYYYFQRPGSIMNSSYGQIALDELDAGDYILENCKQFGCDSVKAATFKRYTNYLDVFFRYPEINKKDWKTFDRIKKSLKKDSRIICRDKNLGIRVRVKAFVIRLWGVSFCKLLNKFI